MELYVHIPFCVHKCGYCDFLSFNADAQLIESYIDALCTELDGLKEQFTTCFIGGGTPSVVPVGLMEKLLKKIAGMEITDEFSIECNPGTVDEEKLRLYKAYGINRISFGLQSADDRELALLGRIHTLGEFLESYELALKCGFENINIDLMSGLPGQNCLSFEKTLKTVTELDVKHLSVYGLIIEEGTRFYELYADKPDKTPSADNSKYRERNRDKISEPVPLPDEDEEREMYHMTAKILKDYGFYRYEISNYAKKGYECHHNLGYWTGEEYIGTGIGAASYLHLPGYGVKGEDHLRIQAARYANTRDIREYIDHYNDRTGTVRDIRELSEELNAVDLAREYIILHLRLTKGFEMAEFERVFGYDLKKAYGKVINRYLTLGLLEMDSDHLRLTERGLDLSNTVMADFLGDE